MTAPWPIVLAIAALGLVIGSFLNVVIYRVPRDESILFPGSHCTSCAAPVKARHNVPVLGWLMLRGRCAVCGSGISIRYPLVEAGTAALFAAITIRFGLSVQLPAYLYLAAIGVTLAMIDFDVRRLPDSIVLPSYVISVLLLMPAGAVTGEWWVATRSLLGMAALWIIYMILALAYPRGMGFGDVKLAGLLGLYLGWLGWSSVLVGTFAGFLLGGVAGAAMMATRRATRKSMIPFGPFMLAGAMLAFFAAGPVAGWYGSLTLNS
jgi:leader peptidase (prepilin peptidase)/N-methyltransferase